MALNWQDQPSPGVCVCSDPQPEHPESDDPYYGQCVTCWRPIVERHPVMMAGYRG